MNDRKQPLGLYRYKGSLLLALLLIASPCAANHTPAFQPARNRADLNAMLQALPLTGQLESTAPLPLDLEPGTLIHVPFALTSLERDLAHEGGRTRPKFAILTLGIPDAFDPTAGAHPNRILFSSVTGDIYAPNAYSAMHYFRATRQTEWILVTVDGDVWPRRDSIQWRLTFMAAAMRYLESALPGFKSANLAFAGYSGGSKMSLYLSLFSAKIGRTPIGLFLGGCNALPLRDAESLCGISSRRIHTTPIVLSIGAEDRISTPKQSRRVAQKLEREGFRSIEVLDHPGGHQLVPSHLLEALHSFEFSLLRP
jgi:predicted esterase